MENNDFNYFVEIKKILFINYRGLKLFSIAYVNINYLQYNFQNVKIDFKLFIS